jgi:hypothetical protein
MSVSEFTFTDPGALAVRDGTIDLESPANAIVSFLVLDAHTPSVINDNLYSDISGNLGTGFAALFAEGDTVDNLLWSAVSTRVIKLDADDLDYGDSVTLTGRYIYLLHRATGSIAAGDLIIGYVDLDEGGADVSSTNGNFDLAWAATGLYVETLTP